MGGLEDDLRRYENEQAENEKYGDSLVEDATYQLKFCYKLSEEDLEDYLREDILGDADYDWEDLKGLKEKVMESQEGEDNQSKE